MGRQKGFTLTELMISIGVLGILAALAVPSYLTYTVRAKASEGILAAESLKGEVVSYRLENGQYPKSLTDLGYSSNSISNPTKYVQFIRLYSGGEIRVRLNKNALGATDCSVVEVGFNPIERNRQGFVTIDWNCHPGSTPTNCRKYLPADCRS